MIDKQKAEENGIQTVDSSTRQKAERAHRLAEIQSILPSVINGDRQLDRKVLEEFLGSASGTSNNQGYELTFAGKGIARALADVPTEYELQAETEQSKEFETTSNVVIRGDNIDALKILYQNYHKKVKVIYIDPPYNLAKDNFIYKNNFRVSDAELIAKFGLDESATDFLHNVYGTRSHSGWLAFMYPRLKLARELLSDDGMIFISIDETEHANLKVVCDEIFGGANFIAQFYWNRTSTPPSISNTVRKKLELVLCYRRIVDSSAKLFGGLSAGGDKPLFNYGVNRSKAVTLPKEAFEVIKLEDGTYGPGKYGKDGRVMLKNQVEVRGGKFLSDPIIEAPFKWSQKTVNEEVSNGTRFYLKSDEFSIRYDRKEGPRAKLPSNLICKDECGVGTNETGKSELERLGLTGGFSYPKPTSLIQYLIQMACGQDAKDAVVLDFFAGSGTTGEAVMRLNAENNGNCKFILVQLDEPIEDKESDAYALCKNNDLDPVISSIMIERLKRAGTKIKDESKAQIDTGFKVFSLKPKVRLAEEQNEQKLLLKVENPRKSTRDTLYNMLSATCKPLDTKIKCLKEDALYEADSELYLIGNIDPNELAKRAEGKINIDGWGELTLEQYLNLDIANSANSDNPNERTVIY